jgi:hypothetical protein
MILSYGMTRDKCQKCPATRPPERSREKRKNNSGFCQGILETHYGDALLQATERVISSAR